MARLRILFLALICALVSPLLIFFMVAQALFGDTDRALGMVLSLDRCGDALFGGDSKETISSRTGRAQEAGVHWGVVLAPCIDFFFGKNHCKNAIGV